MAPCVDHTSPEGTAEHARALIAECGYAHRICLTKYTKAALGDVAMLEFTVVAHHQGHGRTCFEHPVGVTLAVAADLGSLRIGRAGINTSNVQRDGVAVAQVQRGVVDKDSSMAAVR